ncbi:fasciclin domain-containing protein [Pedobacter miscanthi]|uniref:FAS1 domain-containing protein n=1 Tax=Pedobacter miscanthi TaxID=2259170 RepID=A0A366L211_9SPHI|nr:fasciclin domain-containing protein [Pedobacter miscanthi]RBQ07876.1 hypothetical protein DRW42_09750 [Pedobacter miscanthi]
MRKQLLLLYFFCIILNGCKKEYGKFYDPPPGQAAQLYLQLSQDPTLSIFVSAIDRVPGLKEELNSSGLFTIMAPDNAAFAKYFETQTTYKSIEEMPAETVKDLVNYHIMKWMLFQGNFLNPGITKTNYEIYKYETKASSTYYDAAAKKMIFYPSKMLQVYTPQFFSYYNVTAQDYAEVYGPGSAVDAASGMNVMAASVIKRDVSSGNGVIHVLDRVLSPPNNIAQELDSNPEFSAYNKFLKRYFTSYTYNNAATIAQGNRGDINGDGITDSLWTRNYATDANLDQENPVDAAKKPLALTAYIPSKSAFTEYLQNKLLKNFYNQEDSIPMHTLQLLYKSQVSSTAYWPSKIASGQALSALGDKIVLEKGDIKSIQMKSNGIFYTTNKVVEPAAFTTVGGPSFFAPKYWYFAEALVTTNLINQLLSPTAKFTVFAPTNEAFLKRGIYYTTTPLAAGAKPGFYRKNTSNVEELVSLTELSAIIGNGIIPNNEIRTSVIGDGQDHFYATQNGSFLAIQNGSLHGSEADTLVNVNIDKDLKQVNGYFHGVDKLIYNPRQSIFELINSASSLITAFPQVNPQYRKFKELCTAAGILTKDFGGTITQVDANKKLTLFVPSNEAITAAQNSGLLPVTPLPAGVVLTEAERKRIAQYISYFFVSDQQIFTDGKITGIYNTRKQSPNSTPANINYLKLNISYSGFLRVTSNGTVSATVIKTDPMLYPQNRIARDGIVQIIDNAFTSQY